MFSKIITQALLMSACVAGDAAVDAQVAQIMNYVNFDEIESQIKQATMRSGIGERVLVGDSFNEQVDELGDSIGT